MRFVSWALAAAIVLAPCIAAATPIRLLTSAQCKTEEGNDLKLSKGTFLPEADYIKLDGEIIRLQRENDQLKEAEKGGSSWKWTIAALAAGFAAGKAWQKWGPGQ